MSNGKPFQSLSASVQNALSPYRIVLVRGITNKFLELERSVRVGLFLKVS